MEFDVVREMQQEIKFYDIIFCRILIIDISYIKFKRAINMIACH
jgi:hypothetical protein